MKEKLRKVCDDILHGKEGVEEGAKRLGIILSYFSDHQVFQDDLEDLLEEVQNEDTLVGEAIEKLTALGVSEEDNGIVAEKCA